MWAISRHPKSAPSTHLSTEITVAESGRKATMVQHFLNSCFTVLKYKKTTHFEERKNGLKPCDL